MQNERWRRIESIFHLALERPEQERAAFLLNVCVGDTATQLDVEALLAMHAQSGILDEGASRLAASAVGLDRSDEGRFLAGTLIASRYRIISLLGRGGIGEVYRASDVKLGQPVALKFLHKATGDNRRMLARLHAEVRIARQVSHPNVCRVYDIGEIDGCAYITMEYVDGEDLASLLRRIGRLPADKATEIARRLCAGLAAAHDRGVLHRDLKPANIMIDGRGQVLITDFGLAGRADQIGADEIVEGTPVYMAPEQLAGQEVSVRSDLYALGLVLYEMYTGKRAFKNSPRMAPAPVSALVKDIDPALDRLIVRCLEEEPRKRPSSALAVAAALPGGDPLTAVLAAGETPSPGMVAAAGEADDLPVRGLVLCLGLVVSGLALSVVLGSKVDVLQMIPFEKPTEVLAQKARDVIESLGYTRPPTDEAFGFSPNDDYQRYRFQDPVNARAQLAKGQPSVVFFWYRQSPRYLITQSAEGVVGESDPPHDVSGMIHLRLDPRGRLLFFFAVPPQMEKAKEDNRAPPDSKALFAAAGLDPARFTSAESEWTPLAGFDVRAAWTGSFPDAPDIPLRIEAAWWRGKPVYFSEISPWSQPNRIQTIESTAAQRTVAYGFVIMMVSIFAVATQFAWRNFRQGRADARGASRLAGVAFCTSMLEWLCVANHVPTLAEFMLFVWAVSSALFRAAAFWLLYMALEPYVRRRWPQSLVSWNRLLAGGFRDPVVGGHLLIGAALGTALAVTTFLPLLVQQEFRLPLLVTSTIDARHLAWIFLNNLQASIVVTLVLFLLFFLLRLLLRRQWLASGAWILLTAGLGSATFSHPAAAAPFGVMSFGIMLLILIRFGLLPVAAGQFVMGLLTGVPMNAHFSAWYAGTTIFALGVVLALSAYSLHTGLAGRALLREGLIDN